jgi:hypothetical protein
MTLKQRAQGRELGKTVTNHVNAHEKPETPDENSSRSTRCSQDDTPVNSYFFRKKDMARVCK